MSTTTQSTYQTEKKITHLDSTNPDNWLATFRHRTDLDWWDKATGIAILICSYCQLTLPSMVDDWGWYTNGSTESGVYWGCVLSCWLGETPMTPEDVNALLNEVWWTREIESHREAVITDILRIAEALKYTEAKPDKRCSDAKIEPALIVLKHLDANADLHLPHFPKSNNEPWFKFTAFHLTVMTKLTPCAQVLWQWILLKGPAGSWFDFDLYDFQAITAEHRRGKPYSIKQIRRAISELEELKLLTIKSERLKGQTCHPGPVENLSPRRRGTSMSKSKKSGTLMSTPGTLMSTPGTLMSTPGTLMSTPEAETLANTEPASPTDLTDINTDLSFPPTHPKEKEKEKAVGHQSGTKTEISSTCPKQGVEILTNLEDPNGDRFSGAKAVDKKQQEWEIAPNEPYPKFVAWRAKHYEMQGGHLAAAATSNAKSEIRKNPERAADLWQQFLEFSNRAADSALARKDAGINPSLPPCLAEEPVPATKGQVAAKLQALNSKALPAEANNPPKPINNAPQCPELVNPQAYTLYQEDRQFTPEQCSENLKRLREMCQGGAKSMPPKDPDPVD